MKWLNHIAALMLLVLLSGNAFSQETADNANVTETENDDLSRLIVDGNKLLTKKAFGLALPVWILVAEQDPSPNVQFKIGLCYRNSIDERDKALFFFKQSATDMTDKYNFNSKSLRQAPYDALYFLAESYLENDEPDSAMVFFKKYQDHYHGEPPIPVDRHLVMCSNAKNARKSPRNVTLVNMGSEINSQFAESNPVLTLDNSILFFSSRRARTDGTNSDLMDPVSGKMPSDIYLAKREANGKYQQAAKFPMSSDANEYPLCLSSDGLTFYFQREEKGTANLYKSEFLDGVWTDEKALGSGINSAFNETGLSISGDGMHLYFCSDREEGEGKFDIYHCEKKSSGKWGRPENLGDVINTDFNEISPFIHPNGKTLFFSSNGNKNKGLGGYDVYYTEQNDDGSWSEPQNMGYPINTTRDDLHYYITQGGTRYYTALNPGNSLDLYRIDGGGYDVESLDIGTEVVTLTTEMDVAEVLEVEKEVQTEVEVVEFVETEVMVESEVEVVDLENLEELEPEMLEDNVVPEDTIPEEPEAPEIDFSSLDIDRLDSTDKRLLMDKVNAYLRKDVKKDGGALAFKTILFDFNSRQLDILSINELEIFAQILMENPEAKVEIVGHTDDKGGWVVNHRVSNERAKVVFEYLSTHGIAPDRMIYYGKGSSQPVASNTHEQGRKLNRRVNLTILR